MKSLLPQLDENGDVKRASEELTAVGSCGTRSCSLHAGSLLSGGSSGLQLSL